MRYTERHCGKAVIKDKTLLSEAMEKLARIEEAEEKGCEGCKYEKCTKQLYPCRTCRRDKNDQMDYMKVQEAIETLSNYKIDFSVPGGFKMLEAIKMAKTALKKQEAERPYLWGDGYSDGQLVYDMYDCQDCGESYEIEEKYNYCPNCGKKLDWSDADEQPS